MLRQVALLLAAASVALAAVAILQLEKKPEEYADCPGCWVSAVGELIPIGESRPDPNECQAYNCRETEVQIESCGAVGYNKTICHETRDLSLPYPDCCTKIVCNDETSDSE